MTRSVEIAVFDAPIELVWKTLIFFRWLTRSNVNVSGQFLTAAVVWVDILKDTYDPAMTQTETMTSRLEFTVVEAIQNERLQLRHPVGLESLFHQTEFTFELEALSPEQTQVKYTHFNRGFNSVFTLNAEFSLFLMRLLRIHRIHTANWVEMIRASLTH